ncbi:MAG TPA: hypothetical protein VJB08_07070 [Candidatus Nanoarchaeia archaeon]|nr:hypothetical protein [Candidatus Nanoarchaeia archaeon]
MNKRGIELSVNFLVMLILSLIVFMFGLYLVYQFFGTAVDLQTQLDEQTEKELQAMLISGERVALPKTQVNLQRGKSYTFGLGILNTLGAEKEFSVNIIEGQAYQGATLIPTNGLDTIPAKTYSIKNTEQRLLAIPVRVNQDAQIGTHTLDVRVCYANSVDSSTHFNQLPQTTPSPDCVCVDPQNDQDSDGNTRGDSDDIVGDCCWISSSPSCADWQKTPINQYSNTKKIIVNVK